MDPEKVEFLSAADEPDVEDVEDVREARAYLRTLIARQIHDDDPPQVWQTARRLVREGIEPSDAFRQLALAIGSSLTDASDPSGPDYLAWLDRLPLPTAAQVEEALVDVVVERQPVGGEDVDEDAAGRLGLLVDDPLTASLLETVAEELLEDGPLAMLPPDLLVHVPSLFAGAVLTHRVTGPERDSGELLAADLRGFARVGLRRRGEPVLDHVGDDGRSRWLGPAGWLQHLEPGVLVAVRVDSDGEIEFAVLDQEPEGSPGMVAALRAAYDRDIEEPWLPVGAEDLLVAVRAADRAAFATPEPPLTELAARAGLEQRGDEFAHDESVWRQAARSERTHRVIDQLGPGHGFRSAMHALSLIEDGSGDVATAREILGELHDPAALEVVPDELLGFDGDPERLAAFDALTARLLAAASRPAQRAVAHWLAALADERHHRVLDAESHLREAAREDPDWPCAQDRLAWYESDRGQAAEACARWRRLGTTPRENEDLAVLAPFVAPSEEPRLGRNDRCWCGSGRKYKVCHLGRPSRAPLPERVGWLCRKAAAYLERRGGGVGDVVMEHAAARASDPNDPEALDAALADPLVLDTVLHESGWFERFLDERGPLLPDDEAMLARAWTLVERTVYEVTAADPGSGLTVRDLRTGERAEVRERSFSREARAGELICARVVPDGETHQMIGGIVRVRPGTEAGLLDLLDDHDAYELLEWVREQERPPSLVTTDGDPLQDCLAVLDVPDPELARAQLDRRYEAEDQGWVWFAEPDDDGRRTARAWMRLDGDVLHVRTMSEPRLDAVLDQLHADLPDAVVTSDERRPVTSGDHPPTDMPAPAEVPPEALLEIVDQMERRWCEERVPALGDRTPREAAADPTRRDEVVRLISSFPELEPDRGMVGLRPARLRELLGLGAEG